MYVRGQFTSFVDLLLCANCTSLVTFSLPFHPCSLKDRERRRTILGIAELHDTVLFKLLPPRSFTRVRSASKRLATFESMSGPDFSDVDSAFTDQTALSVNNASRRSRQSGLGSSEAPLMILSSSMRRWEHAIEDEDEDNIDEAKDFMICALAMHCFRQSRTRNLILLLAAIRQQRRRRRSHYRFQRLYLRRTANAEQRRVSSRSVHPLSHRVTASETNCEEESQEDFESEREMGEIEDE